MRSKKRIVKSTAGQAGKARKEVKSNKVRQEGRESHGQYNTNMFKN